MSHGATSKPLEPLRGVERLEWARVALEEAVGRMVKNPGEQVYVVAAMSRYRELENIRGPVEVAVEKAQRPDEPPIHALVCLNCLRGVATIMQHYTGRSYMCGKRSGGPRIGRPPKVDPAVLDQALRRMGDTDAT